MKQLSQLEIEQVAGGDSIIILPTPINPLQLPWYPTPGHPYVEV